MHPFAVLAEVIKAGPDFLLLGTFGRSAAKAPVSAVRGGDLVLAFFVSVKIIPSTEACYSGTVRDLTSEGLFVTKEVLSNGAPQSVCAPITDIMRAHLCSD